MTIRPVPVPVGAVVGAAVAADAAPARAEAGAFSLGASAADDLARIRHLMPRLLIDLSLRLRPGGRPFPLLHFGEAHKAVHLDAATAGAAEDWFFIGDLHGDFFALHTLLRHAEAAHAGCRVLFLGDMVDRGDHPLECVFLLLAWALARPGRLAWIAGNHDVAFDLPEGATHFTALVSPAELLTVLNTHDSLHGFRRELGRFFVELGRRLPRALLFPDGLLATHGGFPLVDRHAEGAAAADQASYLAWLNSPGCLEDFTWTRLHRLPKKLPNRHTSGSQYGFKDFEAFCALKPQWFPVKRMITGHEHPADGFAVHAAYKVNPAMTLVGFGFDEMRDALTAYHHYPDALHMARGRCGALPEVLQVPVDRRELQWMYPPPEPPPAAVDSPAGPALPTASPVHAAHAAATPHHVETAQEA